MRLAQLRQFLVELDYEQKLDDRALSNILFFIEEEVKRFDNQNRQRQVDAEFGPDPTD
jgi:hypothetical protein